MNVKLESLNEIEEGLNNFDFFETNNSKIPIMGRIIIGNISDEPLEELNENLKMIVLEIGLESTDNTEDYEWYWEITVRDISTTESVSKRHNTGYTAQYKPSCRGCSCTPMELQGDMPRDFSKLIIDDITKNFDIKNE
jgi:hypothetical protein